MMMMMMMMLLVAIESMTNEGFCVAAFLLMCTLLFAAINHLIYESSLRVAAIGKQWTRRDKVMDFNMYNGSVRGTVQKS